MITCVTYDNLERTGKAFCSQFELRHKCFIERQSYNVFSYNSREYDEYDNPSAVYLVYQNYNGDALGVSRLTPFKHRSMLLDLWPDMIVKPSILEGREVWEGTRFCIEKSLPSNLRRKIAYELVLAYLEFSLERGIESIIGIMHAVILKKIFQDVGVKYELIGPEKVIDGMRIQAAEMRISYQQLLSVRSIAGISSPVLIQHYYSRAAVFRDLQMVH